MLLFQEFKDSEGKLILTQSLGFKNLQMHLLLQTKIFYLLSQNGK
jgi:hypothetical protein